MFGSQLGHIEDSAIWARRDPALQYPMQTSQGQESAAFQDSQQLPPGLSPYNLQYPVIQTPLASPDIDGEYQHNFADDSRRSSLAHSFDQLSSGSSFDTAGSHLSPTHTATDYFSFPVASQTEEPIDEDLTIFAHPEIQFQQPSLPSPPTTESGGGALNATSKSGQIQSHKVRPSGNSPSGKGYPTSASPTKSTRGKRDHNEVERCYRNRLNEKIDALAKHLFSQDASQPTKRRVRPPKCLVISRAKERLDELESQNSALESEVAALKQQVAVLNHLIVTSKTVKRRARAG